MLKKGPHLAETVRFLAGIHQRMKFHQEKKKAMQSRRWSPKLLGFVVKEDSVGFGLTAFHGDF